MNPRWISSVQVARLLGVSRPTARKRLEDATVPGRVVYLGYPRIDRKVFESWLKKQGLAKPANRAV